MRKHEELMEKNEEDKHINEKTSGKKARENSDKRKQQRTQEE